MTSSPALKWLLVLLVPLTFGWKLAARPEPADELAKMSEFLSRHEFEVTEQIMVESVPTIQASSGACHMIAFQAWFEGFTRDLIRNAIGTGDRQYIVSRGMLYAEQPTWLTVTTYWWSKHLHNLGITRGDLPIAIAATATCDAEHLPWHELAASDPVETAQ